MGGAHLAMRERKGEESAGLGRLGRAGGEKHKGRLGWALREEEERGKKERVGQLGRGEKKKEGEEEKEMGRAKREREGEKQMHSNAFEFKFKI
jgi:hypothetical protein